MEQAELNKIIQQARLNRSKSLYLQNCRISSLPESIGNLVNLTHLYLPGNQLTGLPESIGNLVNLTHLYLSANQLTSLPKSMGNLANLVHLSLGKNQIISLPESIGNLIILTYLNLEKNQLICIPDSIGNLVKLTYLELGKNQLTSLPESIGNLVKLSWLNLAKNKLTSMPKSIGNLSKLNWIDCTGNPLVDLSNFQAASKLQGVRLFDVTFRRQYWTKLSKWKSKWLLDEDNAEIRIALIAQIGYKKICRELNAITTDTWREYTLLKITSSEEPMVLLKMTCPSTEHTHILCVPPEMTSAEAAITWVNHGIHPDRFAAQT